MSAYTPPMSELIGAYVKMRLDQEGTRDPGERVYKAAQFAAEARRAIDRKRREDIAQTRKDWYDSQASLSKKRNPDNPAYQGEEQ